MTGRRRLLLSLLLAVLMLFTQQGGYRHVVGHAGDSAGLRGGTDAGPAASESQPAQSGAPVESRDRTRLCADCLALSALGGLPAMPAPAHAAATADEVTVTPAWQSLPLAVPTPRAQAPPSLS
jgi:hypothetical protein